MADTNKIVQDDKAGLGDILSRILDYISSSEHHFIFLFIRKQFLRRIFHYLAACFLDSLCQDRGNSYGIGIQLKLVLTKIEEWTRAKVGTEYGQIAVEELEPVRQAANVICYVSKEDLLQETTRNAVCPTLRPAHLSHLLKAYKPDQFDNTVTSASLLSTLDKQDQKYVPTSKTFNPSLTTPLDFNFEMSRLDLSYIILPKLVIDRSGFSFLKATSGSSSDAKHEKW